MSSVLSKSRITLRDVARRLNVSHTTISRALRDDLQVSKTLREQVQKMAKEMGYKPDPMLSALAHYRRSKGATPVGSELAWINSWPNPKGLRALKEFNLYWKGAFEEAEQCGFRLEEFVMDKNLSSARLGKILRARNIRGILLPPRGEAEPNYRDFHWDDFCVVRFGHSIPFPHAHLVSSDQLTDGLIAFENIWENGYRRIGLATSAKVHTRFSAGFLFSQMKRSPDRQLPALILAQERNEDDRLLLASWLKKHKPDAILTDVRELHDMLEEMNYRVPQDIGLAALSVLDGNADAGIDQNSEEIGKVAVQLLISLINHNECGIPNVCREVLVEGQWVNGSTLPLKCAK
jgi:LacI family transcriptional regulator, galactose operon repressor